MKEINPCEVLGRVLLKWWFAKVLPYDTTISNVIVLSHTELLYIYIFIIL